MKVIVNDLMQQNYMSAEIDEIQIRRWRAFRRHKAQIEQNCVPMDIKCRAKQRQALLQWAYNPFF